MSLSTKLRRVKISSFEPMKIISWVLLVLAQKKQVDHTVTLCTSAHVTRNILRNSIMCWSHADLSGMYCHLGWWWHPDLTVIVNHVCVHDPIAAEVCAEVQVQYCYQRSFRTMRLEPQPEALVVSRNHATSRTIPTWVAVLPPRAKMSSRARLLLRGPCLGPWSSCGWDLRWCLWCGLCHLKES